MTDVAALFPDFTQAFGEMMLPNTYQTGTQVRAPIVSKTKFSVNFSFSGAEQVKIYSIIFIHDKGFGRK